MLATFNLKENVMIDLNNPIQFTLAGVTALIASKTDSEDRQLRVNQSGIAYLSDTVGAEDIDDILFRFETWDAKEGLVGVTASNDQKWVSRIYEALRKNFPNPTKLYIDIY